jgi:hypothetical protein
MGMECFDRSKILNMEQSQTRSCCFFLIISFMLFLHGGILFLELNVRSFKEIFFERRPLRVKLNHFDITQVVQSEHSEQNERKENAFFSDQTRSFDQISYAKKISSFKSGNKIKITKDKEIAFLNFSDLAPVKRGVDAFKKSDTRKQHSISVVSSTDDFLKDIKTGDMTHLNTVEYKYYGFFHRIREKLSPIWNRALTEKSNLFQRLGKRIISKDGVMTSLIVSLNLKGEIVFIRIKSSCGIKELDDVAIESFLKAAPFSNPPKGLLVLGRLILEWGFVVKNPAN